MTEVINQNAFAKQFSDGSVIPQALFNQLLAVMQNSPSLVHDINTFAASYGDGRIVLGTPGKGSETSLEGGSVTTFLGIQVSSTSGTPEIFMDPTQLQSNHPLTTIATIFGHELGHALLPNGLLSDTAQATTADQAAQMGETAEGVALSEEYKVAQELGTTMWSGFTLQQQLNQVVQRDLGNPGQTYADEVQTAGSYYGTSVHPSPARNLFYDEWYRDQWVVNQCAGSPYGATAIDWTSVQHNQITYTTNADGSCTVNPDTIQLLNGLGKITIQGKLSSSGAPVSVDETIDTNGDGIADGTEVITGNSSGNISETITGTGNISYLSDANLSLASGASATVYGTGNTASGGVGSALTTDAPAGGSTVEKWAPFAGVNSDTKTFTQADGSGSETADVSQNTNGSTDFSQWYLDPNGNPISGASPFKFSVNAQDKVTSASTGFERWS